MSAPFCQQAFDQLLRHSLNIVLAIFPPEQRQHVSKVFIQRVLSSPPRSILIQIQIQVKEANRYETKIQIMSTKFFMFPHRVLSQPSPDHYCSGLMICILPSFPQQWKSSSFLLQTNDLLCMTSLPQLYKILFKLKTVVLNLTL